MPAIAHEPSRTDAPAELISQWVPSPLGKLLAMASDEGIVLLDFCDGKGVDREIDNVRRRFRNESGNAVVAEGTHRHLDHLATELEQYFNGTRTAFTVPLLPHGTAFQMRVWNYLRGIPFGETRTYGHQARSINAPTASRAVGAANGQNSLAVVIPCHRVIGSSGKLTGYAGGVQRKQWLLQHEQNMWRA